MSAVVAPDLINMYNKSTETVVIRLKTQTTRKCGINDSCHLRPPERMAFPG